ncbi:MAG: hypothetical protein ABIS23_03305 [Sphingomicrobium sp.]
MSSSPTAQEIARDARWLVQAVDPNAGVARMVELDREAYRAASFLDDRMMSEPRTAHLISLALLTEAADLTARSDARWIFHIGHVGSTLISRLLGELPGVLAVREPRSLRDVAVLPSEARLPFVEALPRLMSRSFGGNEIACVKATSFVCEIAPELVPPGERALFVTASPRNYVASILAGPNSVKELHTMTDFRAQRMASRVFGLEAATTSDAHRAAAAWACEMTSLEAAAAAMPDRAILWLDFDAMLGELGSGLGAAARHLGFAASEEDLTRIISGPIVGRYSKAMEHDYSPALRRELIADADAANTLAIDGALAMLEQAARQSLLLERALARAGEIGCSGY